MTTTKKISLTSLQYGIFFSDPIARPDLITKELSETYAELFDDVPINLPIPVEIIDFPLAQLKSKDSKWSLNVSRIRADITYSPEFGQLYEDLQGEVKKIQEMLSKAADKAREQSVKISRITNISNFIYLVDNPIKYLRDKFFEDKNEDYSELVIRFNKPIQESSIDCNNITQYQISNFKEKEESEEIKVLRILKDFNTDPKKKSEFSDAEIDQFFEISKNQSHSLEFNEQNHE